MSALEIHNAIDRLVLENQELKMKIESYSQNSVDALKFYNTEFTTDMIARLHGVSTGLVRKYIEIGLIDQHPNSSDRKLLVRGSDALILDFKSLKMKAKYN